MNPVDDLIDDLQKVVVVEKPVDVGPTVLGCDVRRDTIGIVNGVSNGIYIEVKFLGTRAYTNGTRVILPKIKDLAEIRYATARALIGYAIHEVAHIRYTDFKAINRIFTDPKVVADFGTDDKKEIVQRQKLIKKLENCIEDYRIEREMTREYPGTKSDLEALRIAIHPKLKTLTTGWFADPRSCGPLALTWLGASINGFQNPHLDRTLSHMPEPVLALVMDWSERMVNVVDTAGAVDLAIAFELEAQSLAKAIRDEADRQKAIKDAEQDGHIAPSHPDGDVEAEPSDPEPGEGDPQDEAAEDESHDSSGDEPAASNQEESTQGDSDIERSRDRSGVSGDDGPREQKDQSDTIDEALRDQEDGSPLDQDAERADVPPAETHDDLDQSHGDTADAGDHRDDHRPEPDANDHGSDSDGQSENEQSIDFQGDRREKQETLRRVEDEKGAPSKEPRKGHSPSDDSRVDLNGDLVDDYVDPSAEPDPDAAGDTESKSVPESRPDGQGQQVEGEGIDGHPHETDEDDGDAVDEIESSEEDAEGDAPRQGGADEVRDSCDTGGADDGMDGGTGGGAFDDVLDEDARIDDAISDMIEDMHDRIAAGETLPEMTPDGADGEVDPTSLLDEISDTNDSAPDYDSSGSDRNPFDMSEDDTRAMRASLHYGDARFTSAPEGGEDSCRHEQMRQKSAGATSTTARTIKRLLMAEEQSGFLANRRSGEFDIRNVSAIARNTGTCYRRSWTRPAPETLLVTLVDFSLSMEGEEEKDERDLESPIAIAMTGALAIEQAVKGTSVNSAMYGFTGASPTVNLTVFKEGRQRETITRRRIGSYAQVKKCCTPTGEAMAAVASRMDKATEKRRILLVLTDGDADNMQLCADVTNVLIRRGIEVVVIGIQNDSAEGWAPVHRTIHHLSDLPAALLATIDPRAGKRRGRRLAA